MEKVYRILAKKATMLGLVSLVQLLLPHPVFARIPNDPLLYSQMSVWNKIGAPVAWDYTVGSRRVVVAVIDTGVDTWHPDLSENIWTNPKEIPDNFIDDDRNGFVDDVHGWNFVENNADARTSVFDKNDDKESVGHGTVVAGLIGARGDNNKDGTGLNWEVGIMPLRAIANSGSGSLSMVIQAVNYAVDNGANIINMSFVGARDDRELHESLYRAYRKGVVVVAAAGNHEDNDIGNLDVYPEYPACDDQDDVRDWMLTVGSVNERDQVSVFSNYGKCVDIAAPGEALYSSERYAPQYGYQDEFGGRWDGTSFAAPLVSGSAALLKAIHPDWTADQIIETLLKTTDPVSGDAAQAQYGRLNIGKAITSVAPSTTPSVWGSLLTINNQKIISRINVKTGEKSDVAYISGGVAVSAAMMPNQRQFAVLIRRQKEYAVQVFDADGRLDKEVALPISEKSGQKIVSLKVVQGGDWAGIFAVERRVGGKKTTISLYDDAGVLVGEVSSPSLVSFWETGRNDSSIYTTEIRNKSLFVQKFSIDAQKVSKFTVPLIEKINSLGIGHMYESGDQLIAVVKRGSYAQQVIVDMSAKSYRIDIIKKWNDRDPLRVLVLSASGGQDVFVKYSSKGGVFPALNARGTELSKITMPQIIGTIQ